MFVLVWEIKGGSVMTFWGGVDRKCWSPRRSENEPNRGNTGKILKQELDNNIRRL